MVFDKVRRHKYWFAVGASVILGLIFIASGLGKLLSGAESFDRIYNPLLGFLVSVFTDFIFWLSLLELIIGLLLIVGIAPKLMAVFSTVLIAGFITNNGYLISRGLGYQPCSNCFGILQRILQVELPAIGALYLDIGMLALVLIILFCYQGSFINIYPWFLAGGRIAEKKNWVGS